MTRSLVGGRVSRVLVAALLAAFIVNAGMIRPIRAATFTIANGDSTTLINDITAFNGDTQDYTLNLATGGTYTLTVVNNGGVGDTNGLPVISNTAHTLTINGNGSTIARGTSGPPPFRFFTINSGATLALNNLTLKNGRLTGAVGGLAQDGQTVVGGAISMSGTLDLNGVTFLYNALAGGNGSTASVTNGGGGMGGAIYNNGGTITGANVLFLGNEVDGGSGSIGHDDPSAPSAGGNGGSGRGGAIYLLGGTLTLTNTAFSGNSPFGGNGGHGGSGSAGPGALGGGGGLGAGGAIFNRGGQVILTADTLANNEAYGGSGGTSGGGGGTLSSGSSGGEGNGGAIDDHGGTVTVTTTTFSNNAVRGGYGGTAGAGGSGTGGAISAIDAATLTVTRSIFTGDSARGGHGGTHIVGISNTIGGLGGSTFGGAIGQRIGGTTTIANSTFTGESATGGAGGEGGGSLGPAGNGGDASGGALYQGGTQFKLFNVTVAANSATSGHGGPGQGGANGMDGTASGGGLFGPENVANSIVASNLVNGSGANCSGSPTDGGHNLEFGGPSTCGFTNNGDPKLDSMLRNNGGPTQTLALLTGSAAINNADPTICAAAFPNGADGVDQRGLPRPATHCAIGAFEPQGPPKPLPPPQPTAPVVMNTPVPLPKPPHPTGQPITNPTPLPLPPRRP